MKILVTGSSGYLGNHFAKDACSKHKIIGIDIKPSEQPIYKEIIFDISKISVLKENLKEIGDIDGIVHFACMTDIQNCEKNQEKSIDINVKSTLALLEFAAKNKIKKFIYVSTGSVYKKTDQEITENNSIEADNFYELTKIKSEQLCKYYSNQIPVIIIRPFFPYGEKTHPGRLINILINRIKKDEEILLNKENKPRISPIYVKDLNIIIEKLLEKKEQFEIYNLTGPEHHDIKETAEIIGEIIGKKPKFKQTENETANFYASADKIEKLGIELKELKNGIKIMIEND